MLLVLLAHSVRKVYSVKAELKFLVECTDKVECSFVGEIEV